MYSSSFRREPLAADNGLRLSFENLVTQMLYCFQVPKGSTVAMAGTVSMVEGFCDPGTSHLAAGVSRRTELSTATLWLSYRRRHPLPPEPFIFRTSSLIENRNMTFKSSQSHRAGSVPVAAWDGLWMLRGLCCMVLGAPVLYGRKCHRVLGGTLHALNSLSKQPD